VDTRVATTPAKPKPKPIPADRKGQQELGQGLAHGGQAQQRCGEGCDTQRESWWWFEQGCN
jgi:hypothetical protein